MRIIGIAGSTLDGTSSGAGKDYVAQLLAADRVVREGDVFVSIRDTLRRTEGADYMREALLGPDAVQMNFADALKEFGRALFGWSIETCWGSSRAREQPDPHTGIVPRRFFQLLGTEAGRATAEDLWLHAFERRLEQYQNTAQDVTGRFYTRKLSALIISDIRFPNEASWVLDHGGELWFVEAPRQGGMPEEFAQHSSEGYAQDLFNRATYHIIAGDKVETAKTVRQLARCSIAELDPGTETP